MVFGAKKLGLITPARHRPKTFFDFARRKWGSSRNQKGLGKIKVSFLAFKSLQMFNFQAGKKESLIGDLEEKIGGIFLSNEGGG